MVDLGVKLQVMKVVPYDSSRDYKTVLWDTASTSAFVRHEHAKKMKFPKKKYNMRVVTLGGSTEEVQSYVYWCTVKDNEGKEYSFTAYDLDEVARNSGPSVDQQMMDRMFPHNRMSYQRVFGDEPVDYIIGLHQAGWQPVRGGEG
jgi:hypothetical protein